MLLKKNRKKPICFKIAVLAMKPTLEFYIHRSNQSINRIIISLVFRTTLKCTKTKSKLEQRSKQIISVFIWASIAVQADRKRAQKRDECKKRTTITNYEWMYYVMYRYLRQIITPFINAMSKTCTARLLSVFLDRREGHLSGNESG